MEKLFVMRWNPAISSCKLEVYRRNCEECPDGFCIDWSIWDHESARNGDFFVMMRVGDYKPGIVFYGMFESDPYIDDDWAGTDKKRHYVLMNCFGFTEDDEPIISAGTLQEAIPEIDWMHGHSGELLADNIASRVFGLLSEKVPDISFDSDIIYDEEDEEDIRNHYDAAEKLTALMQKFSAFNPTIHSRKDEGYDWLSSRHAWCRCLLIPNPDAEGPDIQIESAGDFILHFGGVGVFYENDAEGYEQLQEDISGIISGALCAYTCSDEEGPWYSGIGLIEPTEKSFKVFIRKEIASSIYPIWNCFEDEIDREGVHAVMLRYFDKGKDKTFLFRYDELASI